MKTFSKLLVLGAALAVSTSMAYADPLSAGAIGVGGPSTYTATTISFSNGYVITSGSGSLTPFTAPEPVNIDTTTPFTVGFMGTAALFSTNDTTGDSLTYWLNSLTQGASYGVFNGTGYFSAYINGVTYMDAMGSDAINITGSSAGAAMSFSADANITPTPEPGSLLLLGTGLLSAAGIARRKFASKLV